MKSVDKIYKIGPNVGIIPRLRYNGEVVHARPFPGVRNSSETTFPEFSSPLI